MTDKLISRLTDRRTYIGNSKVALLLKIFNIFSVSFEATRGTSNRFNSLNYKFFEKYLFPIVPEVPDMYS